MNKDRGQIDQSGGRTTGMSSQQAGSRNFDQPQWDVSPDQIQQQVGSLDSFVIVGTKAGQPFIASTDGKAQAQQLLKTYAHDLLPQNA